MEDGRLARHIPITPISPRLAIIQSGWKPIA